MSVKDELERIRQAYPACPLSSPEMARRWLDNRMDALHGPRLEFSEGLWRQYMGYLTAWRRLIKAMEDERAGIQERVEEA